MSCKNCRCKKCHKKDFALEIDLPSPEEIQKGIADGSFVAEDMLAQIALFSSCDDDEYNMEDRISRWAQKVFRYEPISGNNFDDTKQAYNYVPSGFSKIMGAVKYLELSEEKKVFDLGCGKGGPALLFAFLTGADVTGVEWNAEHCQHARDTAEMLNLKNIRFINADVREVELDEADAFFMYAPFVGKLLDEVLDTKIQPVAAKKEIKLFYHGPDHAQCNNKWWLTKTQRPENHEDYDYEHLHSSSPKVFEKASAAR